MLSNNLKKSYSGSLHDQCSFPTNQIAAMGMHSFDCEMDYLFLDYTPQDDELSRTACLNSPKPGLMGLTGPDQADQARPTASFEILQKYGSRCRRFDGEKVRSEERHVESTRGGLSMETMIQLAAEMFIKSSCRANTELSMISHPYPSSVLCHTREDSGGVELLRNLLWCAERVDRRRYDQARPLLIECERMCSPGGSPVQRLVYYFIEALHEKIDRETGRISCNKGGDPDQDPDPLAIAFNGPTATTIAFHKELPISQITKFAGIQAVVDNVGDRSRIHFIDLEIRKGIHCTILMQALGDRCRHLKVTAVGSGSRASIDETGRRLVSFAATLGLNFSFHVVMVEDMLDLNESQFEAHGNDEAVVVFAEYTLMRMIGQPNRLEHVMRVVRVLNPCVMVVAEAEADCNSPVFVDRFVGALVFYGAFFECMADCLNNDEENRFIAESTCFSSSIRNMVAAEGDERKIRHVRMSVWRSFFTRSGFKETELSMSSVYQANLVRTNFPSGSSFTLDVDGKSLIISWKGTPISSVSAWKF